MYEYNLHLAKTHYNSDAITCMQSIIPTVKQQSSATNYVQTL